MVHLFDIARQAYQGAGFEALSRQVGLDTQQTQRAVEALLPAFSLAFQRNMLNPAAFADMLGLVASGRYAPYFDGSPSALSRVGQASGDTLLNQLFGSPEIGRQVASQASAVTGIGTQVLLQQLMPILAATLIGGMFRYASLEGFAELLGHWSTAIKAAVAANRPAPAPPSDPWSAWMEVASRMMGASSKPPRPPPDTPFDAWTKAIGSMLGGGGKGPPASSQQALPAPSKPDPLQSMVEMFETGREVQAQHLAQLQRIIGGAWAPNRTETPP